MTADNQLCIQTDPAQAVLFAPLFGAGAQIPTTTGISLLDLLCGQLAIAPDYIEKRVQTIFVNGRTVDQVETVKIADGMVIALSAAMPGLMGATLRKGGLLAGFRRDISYRNEADRPTPVTSREALVTLKLFNLVARELAPQLLQRGVSIDGRRLGAHLAQLGPSALNGFRRITWNQASIQAERLLHLDWPAGGVRLVVGPKGAPAA